MGLYEALPEYLHPLTVRYAALSDRIIASTVIDFESWYGGEPCWIWIRANNGRYGKIGLRWKSGPRKGQNRNALAHRMALQEFKNRRLTTRSVAKHLCNNTLCCNPAHLVGGTQKTNVRQCVREGRHGGPYRAPVRDMRNAERAPI